MHRTSDVVCRYDEHVSTQDRFGNFEGICRRCGLNLEDLDWNEEALWELRMADEPHTLESH